MEHLCSRCARLASRSARSSDHVVPLQRVRRFATTPSIRKDGPVDLSKAPDSNSNSKQSSGSSRFSSLVEQAVRIAAGGSNKSPSTKPQPGQLLQRKATPRLQNTSGNTTSRQAGSSPPGNLLLRRTAPPRTGSASTASQRGGGAGRGGRAGVQNKDGLLTAGQQQTARNRAKRSRPRAGNRIEEDEEDEPDLDARVEAYVRTHVDPPATPTEALPYTPTKTTQAELRADWPNTPLSSTGLTESVIQRIEWLARRLPHGWQSAEQLAERYHKGELVRFESQEEKQAVLALAAELANARAGKLTDRKGEQIAAEDMSFDSLADRQNEKTGLVESYVQGKYPQPEKQKMSFMDGIMRQLVNNESYSMVDAEKFMQKLETLIPASALQAAAAAAGSGGGQANAAVGADSGVDTANASKKKSAKVQKNAA